MSKCVQCGAEYDKKKTWQRFCKDKCRDDYWVEMRQLATRMNTLRVKEEKKA